MLLRKEITKSISINSKRFRILFNSKIKVGSSLSELQWSDGSLITCDSENCEIANRLLCNSIKTSGSESRGQEEVASTRIFKPMRPLQ